jgi:hypothetical protein
MAQDRNTIERDECRDKILGTTLVAETLRSAAVNREAIAPSGKSDENVSWFWKIFGGTILSIVALVIVTAYTQVSSTLTDLRRDFSQMQEIRADFLKKDEFSSRLTTLWGVIKELQTAQNSLATASERARLLDLQMEKQARTSEDDRRDLTRKLDEQRRAIADEHKDFQRRMEDQLRQMQTLAERLASLEGHTAGTAAAKTPPATPSTLKKLTRPLTGS